MVLDKFRTHFDLQFKSGDKEMLAASGSNDHFEHEHYREVQHLKTLANILTMLFPFESVNCESRRKKLHVSF